MKRAVAALPLLLGACSNAPVMSYMGTAGPAADSVTRLGWGLTLIALTVIVATGGVVLWATLRRTPERSDEGRRAVLEPRGRGLTWIYTGIPLTVVILIGVFIWTMSTLSAVTTPKRTPALTLEITGHQWWWEVRYRNGNPAQSFVTANEIHIPVGVPVQIRLATADVIHSFWVPKLAGKTDLIPGQNNTMWIQADRPGVFRGQCAEYCGLEHAMMAMYVVADSRADFAAWWAGQLKEAPTPSDSVARSGEMVFQRSCGACHAIRGTDALGRVGPDLTHLMTRRTLAAGMLPNTRGHLAGWVANAQGIKPGARMPAMNLSSAELQALLAYLETLH